MSNNRIMQTIVKLAGSIDPSLAKSIEQAEKQFEGMDKEALKTKASMLAFGAATVAVTVTVGKKLYELGAQFDEAFDTIRVGTGATGEALEALKDDFKEVYSSVPGTMEDAGKAIADYNTRLGLTGAELQDVSKQAISVSKMLGEDLTTTIETSSQAFQQWGIKSKDMTKQMDHIFKVSQSTGIGFNKLMTNMQTYGPQLQEMGYSFEQASAMMGQMEKAGINTEEVLGAMKKAVGTLAKEGISASAGMQIYYEKIQKAGSAAEAAAIANEVFGMRAGSTVADAIRKGTLSVDAFTKSIQNNGETIMGAMEDTMDAAEKWELLIKEMQIAIEPLASAIFDLIGGCVPIIATLLKVVAPLLTFISKALVFLTPAILGVVSALGSLTIITTVNDLMALWKAGTLASTFANNALVVSLRAVWAAMAANPVTLIIGAVVGLVTAIIMLWKNWDKVTEACKKAFEWMKKAVGFKSKGSTDSQKALESADIPKFAKGGFTSGISIAGEEGTEAVISFNPAYRNKNLGIWEKAGRMLGVGSSGGSSYNLGGFSFSPKIIISESMSADDVINKLKSAEGEFCDMIDEWMARKTSGSYSSSSFAY